MVDDSPGPPLLNLKLNGTFRTEIIVGSLRVSSFFSVEDGSGRTTDRGRHIKLRGTIFRYSLQGVRKRSTEHDVDSDGGDGQGFAMRPQENRNGKRVVRTNALITPTASLIASIQPVFLSSLRVSVVRSISPSPPFPASSQLEWVESTTTTTTTASTAASTSTVGNASMTANTNAHASLMPLSRPHGARLRLRTTAHIPESWVLRPTPKGHLDDAPDSESWQMSTWLCGMTIGTRITPQLGAEDARMSSLNDLRRIHSLSSEGLGFSHSDQLQMATTVMDSPPHLSQEILDLIVDELSSGVKRYDRDPVSRSTLTSCALVSKLMSARARGHLFSTISLWWGVLASTAKARRARIRALKHIMEADPQFVTFVRTLELSLDDDVWGTDAFPGVLTMLFSTPSSGLHSLHLILSQVSSGPRLQWLDVEGAGRKAFINLCLSGCLTELVVDGPMRDPILLFAKIPKGLVSMELSKVSFPPVVPESGTGLDVGDGEGAKLEKLRVDDVSAIALFADLEAGSALATQIFAMIQGLKTLELGRESVWQGVRHFAFAPVLQHCKRSLQRLVWSIEPSQDHISVLLSRIPLSSFTALRFLTFLMCTKDGIGPDVNTCHIFSAIQESTMPSLEDITFFITLFVPISMPRNGIIDELTDPSTGWDWGALDVALASATRYPSLAMVEIIFANVGPRMSGLLTKGASPQEKARLHLQAVFPSFLARGGDLKISLVGVSFYERHT
ncbi:unnamed protein product [Cyclocybe aegerita]|uniref:Uncharacterized protein n=1 Tax=Cyclocybe aegerita TaxID=1973307 RepID=A0A8S0XQZ6_CYCAE|nr:unnamed protein product [Cyclocybe aegerita]